MVRNIALYPWFHLFRNLMFWQATWFLYFQQVLSASEAILLYAIYDIATTVLEVPSGYASDRLGRRVTLIASALFGVAAMVIFATAASFAAFIAGQVLLGAMAAFASGTDTSLLYESLNAEARADEVEEQELKAWRYGFVALAVSAVTGGAMALLDGAVPFAASAVSALGVLVIALAFTEPPHRDGAPDIAQEIGALRRALTQPTLRWLFAVSLLMYAYSHIPFVFGQPFIEEAMASAGFTTGAPLVSGTVSAIMMGLSVLVSLFALRLRRAIGLAAILLLAFAMQIGLAAAMALSGSLLVIGLLFLRMVPDSMSRPFIQARIQPLLEDGTRATYLSLQSLAGRVLFSGSLIVASGSASGQGALSFDQIHTIAGWYAVAGLVALLALALTARRAKLA